MTAYETAHSSKYEMQSASLTLNLLDLLTDTRALLTLSWFSDRLGISKNKMFRLLATLEQREVVERCASGGYRLGGMAFALARRILASESLLSQARPVMAELAKRLDEAVYLASYSNGTALLQDMIDCRQAVKATSFVGSALPGLQKIEKQSAALPPSKQKLIAGVQVAEEALDLEITTVSAEFGDSGNSSAGALVVLAPSFRMTPERIRSDIAPALLAGARRLSALLGKPDDPARAAPKPLMSLEHVVSTRKLEFLLPNSHRDQGSSHQPHK